MKNEMINQLAQESKTEESAFTTLYTSIEPQFNNMVYGYFRKHNLGNFNFEVADYISAIGLAMFEAIKDYDSTKGDFMPRLAIFAQNKMKDVNNYNLASKRFDKTKQVISFDQLFEAEEFDIEDESAQVTDTAKLVSAFVNSDKDGEIIKILTSTSDNKVRKELFIAQFGKYEATERKKVQRVRARLQDYLNNSGVFI